MKLLHIEDEKNIVLLYQTLLKEEFPCFEFLGAFNGTDGLRMFYEHKPDIVLLDILMPDIDGIQVLQRIKTTNPNTIVIMVTAYDYRDDFSVWVSDAYVVKSTDLSNLIATIKQLIETRVGKNRIFQDNFPFPIAYNFVSLRSRINAKEKLDTLFHLTEFTLKYLVCMLLAENIKNGKDVVSILANYKHVNLTLGKWYELLMTLSKLCFDKKAELYVPELPAFFYKPSKQLTEAMSFFSKIIQIRNEIHKRPFLERQAEKVASEIWIMLLDIFDKCIFLKDYILQVIESAMPAPEGDKFVYNTKYLMGSHPEFLLLPAKESKIYPYRKIFLKRVDSSEILIMHPYIIFDYDSAAHRDDIFIFEKIGDKTVYKSSQQGHFIERNEPII